MALERTAKSQFDKSVHQPESGDVLNYPWPAHDISKSEISEEIAALKQAVQRR
jgi:hypothetical protein